MSPDGGGKVWPESASASSPPTTGILWCHCSGGPSREYEKIRRPVLFDTSVAERAEEVGVSESTLRRRIEGFREYGMESLFSTEKARRKRLPDTIRRFIVDLKAEYPPFSLGEIANIVHACFGRKPDPRSVQRVLDEEPTPLKILGLYPSYHEMDSVKEEQPSWSCVFTDGARGP